MEWELFKTAYVDDKRKVLMDTVNKINKKYGKSTVHYGFSAQSGSWEMKQDRLSPKYTTDINQLRIVKC